MTARSAFVRGLRWTLSALEEARGGGSPSPQPRTPRIYEPQPLMIADDYDGTGGEIVDDAVAAGKVSCSACGGSATRARAVVVGGQSFIAGVCAGCFRSSARMVRSEIEDHIGEKENER